MNRCVAVSTALVLAVGLFSTGAVGAGSSRLLYVFTVGSKGVSIIDMESQITVATKPLGATPP